MLFCGLLRSAGPGSFHHSHLSLRGQAVSNCTWFQGFQLRAYASALPNPKRGENQSRTEGQDNSPSPSDYPRILRLMKRVWFPSDTNSSYDNLMLWAASTIAFFGFCRSGEITTPSDNSYDPMYTCPMQISQLTIQNVHLCCPLT